MELSLVMPAYNEEARIARTLKGLVSAFEGSGLEKYEIIVVVDSKDGTAGSAKLLRNRNIKVIQNDRRLGKGASVSIGLQSTKYSFVGYVDADESISASILLDMARFLEKDKNLDGVIASRRHPLSVISNPPPIARVFFSFCFNLLVRLILGLSYSDTQCGAKVFRKGAIKGILPLRTHGFSVDAEILYRLRKCRISEYPVRWAHSEGSNFSLIFVPAMFWELIRIRLGGL